MISLLKPIDDKIVLLGMSCVGKTKMAESLLSHKYYCFDALFPWHVLETIGGSIKRSLLDIKPSETKFVLDGWHNSDLRCKLTPKESVPYLIYADYSFILSNYRVPISGPQAFFNMYQIWYKAEFAKNTRFIKNTGSFSETSKEEFIETINTQSKKIDKIWNKDKWTWN